MKSRVYVETTVVSYLTAKPSRDVVVAARQEVTRQVWPRLCAECEVYVSGLTVGEAARGDQEAADARLRAIAGMPVLPVDAQAENLAQALLDAMAFPIEAAEDALHVAAAAVNGMHFLLTWNFAHLNNAFTRSRIRDIIEEHGLECPEICSPEELFGEDS